MSILPLLDIELAALVVMVAFGTIAARTLFAAVVSYVAYGLLLALVWVRLFAPDVALTEAAVGSGVTGVLLITAGKRLVPLRGGLPQAKVGRGLKLAAGLVAALATAVLSVAIALLPDPAPSLAPQAAAAAAGPGAGLGNPITAVLISYRSFDTMLEKVVLILAVTGVWSIGRSADWGSRPATLGKDASAPPMALLARLLVPLGVVIGVHVFWVGADEPGGAFQSGALLAAMWMVMMMSGLSEPPRIGGRSVRLALIAGPAVFLTVGVAGAVVADGFFAFPPSFAKPLILFVEAVMVLSITVALPLLVAGPPSRKAEP